MSALERLADSWGHRAITALLQKPTCRLLEEGCELGCRAYHWEIPANHLVEPNPTGKRLHQAPIALDKQQRPGAMRSRRPSRFVLHTGPWFWPRELV
jgi:hypothetical protein